MSDNTSEDTQKKCDESSKINESKLRPMLQKFNEDLGVYINDDQRFRLGKVLTIIDAAISDPEQRKAIKDLVQNDWWNSRHDTIGRMPNPHTDIRGICIALGFNLYPATTTSPQNEPFDEEKYASERYAKLVK